MDTTAKKLRRSPIKNGSFNSGNKLNKNRNDPKSGGNLSNKIIELQHQLAEYDDEFKELIESNEFLATEKQILEESLEDAEQKIQQLNKTKDELEKLIEDLKKNKFQASDISDLHFLKIENENLKNELEFKKQEMSKFRLELNAKQELIQQQNVKLEEKESKIDNLKKQISEYNMKLFNLEDSYKEKINQLQADYLQKDEQYNVMVSKYIKHRKIWEENYEKANFEVKKLDEVIDNVIATLNSKIDIVGQIPEIKLLLDQLRLDQ